MPPADRLFAHLTRLHALFDAHGIWHTLAYGTLLGGVRDGDLVPWDDDLDFFVRPTERAALLALGPELEARGLGIHEIRYPARVLALRPRGLRDFDGGVIRILEGRRKVADLFVFTPFSDGVLRRYDLEREVYWSPHASFPAFYFERPETIALRGQPFPTPACPEQWLEIVYGRDWRVPRRSRALGGLDQRNRNIYGHRVVPHLRADLRWCRDRGWDRWKAGEGCPTWPRDVRGAGPIGPTPRTEANSRSLWWRDLDELVRNF